MVFCDIISKGGSCTKVLVANDFYMDTLMKADIFFFVTTIAVVVFLVLGSIALYYLISVLRNLRDATRNINHAMVKAEDEISEVKDRIVDSTIFNFLFAKKKKRKTSRE